MNVNNGQTLTNDKYSAWGLGEPNGESIENCVAVDSSGYWMDVPCNQKTCSLCELPSTPVYILRG